jgi:hypothetical protein
VLRFAQIQHFTGGAIVTASTSTATDNSFWSGWIKSESQETQSIKIKPIYIDINSGNLTDGVIFSQIMYWHTPNEKGENRLRVFRNGHFWLAKSYEDWWKECRVPERTARAALTRIEKRGLIEKHVWQFDGKPTIHVRVIVEVFEQAIKKADPSLIRLNQPIGSGQTGQNQSAKQDRTFKTKNTTKTTTENKTTTRAPHPQDTIFNAIRDHILDGKGDSTGLGWKIGSYKSCLLKDFPDVSALDIELFAAWYKRTQIDSTTGKPLAMPGYKNITAWFRKWRDFQKQKAAVSGGESPTPLYQNPSWIKPLRGITS